MTSFPRPLRRSACISLFAAALSFLSTPVLRAADAPEPAPPAVGDTAPDFTLHGLDGQSVALRELTAKGPVVLVMLRGWPGYQCPICERQVEDFIQSAPAFAEAGAQVVFVYPGPADDLKAHAEEFKSWKGKQWPSAYLYLLDPDYTMVNAYHLRWDKAKETAYPSTFVLDGRGVVSFAKISHNHGDRSKAADVVAEARKVTGK